MDDEEEEEEDKKLYDDKSSFPSEVKEDWVGEEGREKKGEEVAVEEEVAGDVRDDTHESYVCSVANADAGACC